MQSIVSRPKYIHYILIQSRNDRSRLNLTLVTKLPIECFGNIIKERLFVSRTLPTGPEITNLL